MSDKVELPGYVAPHGINYLNTPAGVIVKFFNHHPTMVPGYRIEKRGDDDHWRWYPIEGVSDE